MANGQQTQTPFTDALTARINAATLAESVRLLSDLARGQSERIDALEARVEALEQRTRWDGHGAIGAGRNV